MLGLLAVGLVAYWPALHGPFFFDDEHFIQRNAHVQSLANIPLIYKSSVTAGAAIPGNFYRPNQQVLFALLHAVFGLKSSLPYHLAVLALHLGNTLLLYRLLLTLSITWLAAAFAAGFFLLHPVQSEAIAYISGAADPLALFFMLLALSLFVPKKSGHIATSLGFAGLMLLALLSKENAVVLFPIAASYAVYQVVALQQKLNRKQWICLISAGVLAMMYSAARLSILDFGRGQGLGLAVTANAYTESLALRISSFIAVLWDYVRTLVLPTELYYEKPYRAYQGLWHARGIFGLSLIIMATLLITLRFKAWPRLALGLLIFGSALGPFIGIVPLNAIWLEHWLYVPMVGLAIMVAAMAHHLLAVARPPWQRSIYVVGILWLVAAAFLTSQRAEEWASPELFYLNEIKHAGGNRRSLNNLAMIYADQGKTDLAIDYFKRAIAFDQGQATALPQPHHNLANSYLALGKVNEAINELRSALRIDPSFVYSLIKLQEIYRHLGDAARVRLASEALHLVQSGQAYDFQAFEREMFEGLGN